MLSDNDINVIQKDSDVPVYQTENEARYSKPAADVYESEEAFVLLIDMPGVTKESINVTMHQDDLIVKSPVKDLHGEKATLLHEEFRARGYYRTFNLGEGIDRENVDAHYDQGVLTVKLFKKEEVRPKEISIR